MNVHTSILLIIFIVSITMLCLSIGKYEPFVEKIEPLPKQMTTFSKLYDIDRQLEENSDNLGWKKFWRENYSKEDENITKLFNVNSWSHNLRPPLLYDGIKDLSKCAV